jgi:hypothetical protein
MPSEGKGEKKKKKKKERKEKKRKEGIKQSCCRDTTVLFI